MLQKELEDFDSGLANRPALTVVTKTDTVSKSDLKEVSDILPSDYILLSAVAGQGSAKFLQAIERELDEQRAKRANK